MGSKSTAFAARRSAIHDAIFIPKRFVHTMVPPAPPPPHQQGVRVIAGPDADPDPVPDVRDVRPHKAAVSTFEDPQHGVHHRADADIAAAAIDVSRDVHIDGRGHVLAASTAARVLTLSTLVFTQLASIVYFWPENEAKPMAKAWIYGAPRSGCSSSTSTPSSCVRPPLGKRNRALLPQRVAVSPMPGARTDRPGREQRSRNRGSRYRVRSLCASDGFPPEAAAGAWCVSEGP